MAARKKKKVEVDFDDEDSVLAEMARALDIDPDELRIKESHLGHFGAGTVYEITIRGGGHKEWNVAANEDAAHELAVAIVKQDLEESPENFNQDFIESHIDMDRLRRDLESDVRDMNEETLRDRSSEEFWKEAAREGMDEKWTVAWDSPDGNGTLAETFASESDAIDAGEDWKREAVEANEDEMYDESDFDYTVEAAEPDDSDIEQLAQSYTDEQLKDPLSYLEDIYGREDAVKKAIEIAGIDEDAAAEEAVDTDGAGHFLSSYDGNMETTDAGLVYWRVN
jgi:hypothetical protein